MESAKAEAAMRSWVTCSELKQGRVNGEASGAKSI